MRVTPLAFVLLLGPLVGCEGGKPAAPAAPAALPSASAVASASASAPQAAITLLGVTLPSGCKPYRDASGVGHEGAPHEAHWAACDREHAALVAWAQAEEKAGRLKPHTMGRWAKGDTTVTPTELAQRPSSAGRPPASARSLLGLYRQGKPRPCPPCQPDSRPPPGCHCP